MFAEIILLIIIFSFLGIIILLLRQKYNLLKENSNLKEERSGLRAIYENVEQKMNCLLKDMASCNLLIEVKSQQISQLSLEKAHFEAQFVFISAEKEKLEKKIIIEQEQKNNLTMDIIKLQEKVSSQIKLESDLKLLLENTKIEITSQNRDQYRAIQDRIETRNKELNKEAEENFNRIIEKDIKDTFRKLQESLSLQHDKINELKKPVDFFTKILSCSKEAGQHGENTILNMLEQAGMQYGMDYMTQVSGKSGNEEKLIADVVVLIPNSGKKDIWIIDSKSSTKLGSGEKELMQSIEQSFQIFSRKDYKSAIERRLKEEYKNIDINHTHVFMYLPFDKMLSKISEEKPEFLRKMKEKEIGILTPVILGFLLDSVKLYSAKLEMNLEVEKKMKDVKILIERASKILEFISDLGKSINQASKKYSALAGSLRRMYVPIVNKMAKPLNVKSIAFDEVNEEDLKYIEIEEKKEAI